MPEKTAMASFVVKIIIFAALMLLSLVVGNSIKGV